MTSVFRASVFIPLLRCMADKTGRRLKEITHNKTEQFQMRVTTRMVEIRLALS